VTGTIPTAWTLADGDVTVTPNSTPGSAVNAEVRGRFFIARNVEIEDGTNSLEASTDADTLAGNSPSSDTASSITLDTSLDEEYTYNANGDLIQKTEDINGTTVQWDYTYDVQGWLIKVEKTVGAETVLVEEYGYDPIGRKYRVETTEGAESTERFFVYDGGSVVLELDEDKELAKESVRGLSLGGGIGGLLYTRNAGGSLAYFHYDGQGNVVSVTDQSRTEVAYYEYDAWGNILTQCGSLANEFRFSTKQASNGSAAGGDAGTGLIDFGYRWYDPSIGRWTQRDPAGQQDSGNLYVYVLNSPLFLYDPWGDVIKVYKEDQNAKKTEKDPDSRDGWSVARTMETKEDVDSLEAKAKENDTDAVLRDLYKIVLTVCGKELLVGLVTSPKVVEIYVHTTKRLGPAKTTASEGAKAIMKGQTVKLPKNGGEITGTGEGSSCTVKYENYTTRTDDGVTAYPDELLVHELQRAWDIVMGTFDMTVVKGGLRRQTCKAVAKMNEYIREKDGQNTPRQRRKYGGIELPE